MAIATWLSFWERPNRIYVSERHRAVHYAQVAADLLSILPPGGDSVLLDYGCGEALEAPSVAARLGRLLLYDAARPVRERLAARFAGARNIAVLDERGLDALPPASLDRVVVNSVLQYLPRDALPPLLARCHGWLRPGGALVLADVVPPRQSAVAAALSLLRTGWRHGFLLAAVAGLAATFASDYRRLRQQAGLTTYDEAAMRALLEDAGFAAERRARNFGFDQGRMTFLARKGN
jgi:SAM-dependent methyltransferase